MFDQSRITVVVPSYKPDEKLLGTVKGILDAGFTDVCVVDDGGGKAFEHVFDEVRALPHCTVLVHEVNRGKGAALKTAFKYIAENRPDCLGAVTADGDGQHLPADILGCAQKMCELDATILGSRDFSQAHVPARSRMGNRITSFVFLAFCGLRITDTQTGLRAIPARFLPELIEIKGDRYEYETNMLLEAKRIGMKLTEHTIETVYIDDNAASHFNPLKDSLRSYSLIIKYILSSACATVTDLLAFYLLMLFCGKAFGDNAVIISTAIARAVSSAVNYAVNRNVVFSGGKNAGHTVLRYYALAIPVMLCSGGLVSLLKILLGTDYAIITTLIKAIVDTLLFFVTFRIQHEWVFRKK
ncbi:MAG: bifunctional glycosyltransferase family 2/GtrA family protein [Clostridia bacterium]|nr:bifunctional glycosyltransferase family 2/GtrA family protein [Clostridia bacterium]